MVGKGLRHPNCGGLLTNPRLPISQKRGSYEVNFPGRIVVCPLLVCPLFLLLVRRSSDSRRLRRNDGSTIWH